VSASPACKDSRSNRWQVKRTSQQMRYKLVCQTCKNADCGKMTLKLDMHTATYPPGDRFKKSRIVFDFVQSARELFIRHFALAKKAKVFW
jgi:hypothetical protein